MTDELNKETPSKPSIDINSVRGYRAIALIQDDIFTMPKEISDQVINGFYHYPSYKKMQ